jgi:hypothetical protein
LLASGLFADLLNANVAEINRDQFQKIVGKPLSLLRYLGTTRCPATPLFTVADHFMVDNQYGVKISYVNGNFKRVFYGIMEQDVPAAIIDIDGLIKDSLDPAILAELNNCAKTYLAYIWHLLSRQPNGENGPLLVNGSINVFYIGDWEVSVFWSSDGWGVFADPVGNLGELDAGGRIFSC